MENKPIGVFDSGVGGLSVFAKLINLLPDENYIYFGDTKNLPYGNKSKEELISIAKNLFDFFEKQNVKAVVMACNTTSATVYDTFKDKYPFKIYPITQTAAKYIAEKNYSVVGVFATAATIKTHAYQKSINFYNKKVKIIEYACPEWAYIVENKLQDKPENIENIKIAIEAIMKNKPQKIILGCTHYPYLTDVLSKFADKDIFIDPAQFFAQYIADDIKTSGLKNNSKDYEPKFYVSSNPKQFADSSKLFYNVENPVEINISKILIK